mgnify:CR=1 FL=1
MATKAKNWACQQTSKAEDWETPLWLFEELDREFGFTVDVCATERNAKCERFFSPEDNGLAQEWQGICWMNPPYGRTIGEWMEKALNASRGGATVVCLVPARTDTAWWHSFVTKASEIRFLKGRLCFGRTCRDSAPFASAIVIYRPGETAPQVTFCQPENRGKVLRLDI